MGLKLENLQTLTEHGFDDLIDVRSPAEYAKDHVPGAVNLPVLDNSERALVGTIYKQESAFKARKVGAALIARNAAHHIETHFAEMDGGYRPLVYCWRGGMRSGSLITILKDIGWRAEPLIGGYNSYRRAVVAEVYEQPFQGQVVLLDGNTGTAKTALLHALGGRGAQVMDLEGLAHHRGSLFGAMADAQPSQKAFESGIAMVMSGLDPSRPLIVEAESSKIGQRTVPPSLWAAMKDAPRIQVAASLDDRAAFLARAYADICEDTRRLEAIIEQLRPYHARDIIDAWIDLAWAGDMVELARELMAQHYDPRYAKQRARQEMSILHRLLLADLSDGTIDAAAAEVMDVLTRSAFV